MDTFASEKLTGHLKSNVACDILPRVKRKVLPEGSLGTVDREDLPSEKPCFEMLTTCRVELSHETIVIHQSIYIQQIAR